MVSAGWSRRGRCCRVRLSFDAIGTSGVSMVRSCPWLTFRRLQSCGSAAFSGGFEGCEAVDANIVVEFA